jgi:hypothetical protein
MKKLGLVLAALIVVSFIAPTMAENDGHHRDRHHHDDGPKSPR